MQPFKRLLYRYRYFAGIVVLAFVISIVAFQLKNNRLYREEIGDTGVIKVGPARETPYHQEYEKALKFLEKYRVLEAAEIYATLMEKEPNVPDPFLGLASCRRMLGDYEGSLELRKKAVKIAPNSTVTLFSLAAIYELLNDYKNAIKYYKIVLKHDSNDPDAHAGLASVYAKEGQYQKAQYHFNRYKILAPDSIYIDRLEKIINNAK